MLWGAIVFLKASDVSTPRSTRACAPVNLAGALVKLFCYFGPAGKISLHGYHCYTVASILIIIIIIIIIIVGCAYKHTNILYLLLYLSYHPQYKFNMFQASRHTYGSVSCSPRKRGTNKQSEYIGRNKKSWFSRIHSSVIPYPNDTKFTAELASTQGRAHFVFD